MEITLKNNICSAAFLVKGAELAAFKKGDVNYIWTIDEAYWNKTSPVLFPIVGRLKNDSYKINGVLYQLPRHGFARNYDFKVIEHKDNIVVFSLHQNKETLKMYPFEFELQIQYELIDSKLRCSYIVFNNSKTKMPFNIGAHPAFSIPGDFENFTLAFNKKEALISHVLDHELFTHETIAINTKDNKLDLSYALFEKDALVFKSLNSNEIKIIHNGNPYLKIQLEDFPYLGVWTKKNAPFLCIEPWFGYADLAESSGELLEKESIQILEPNTHFKCSFSIEIE